MVGFPFQLIGTFSLLADHIGVQIAIEIDVHLLKQGGSARDAERSPVHGVGHEIVGGGEIETFQQGDFVQFVTVVFALFALFALFTLLTGLVAFYLHLQFVAKAKRCGGGRPVAGHPVQETFHGGIADRFLSGGVII